MIPKEAHPLTQDRKLIDRLWYKFLSQVDSALYDEALVFVGGLGDLPRASGGVITLAANVTYFFYKAVDLHGSRLVAGQNTTILGTSSENASITSTGLGVGVPLLSTEWTMPVRNITFRDVDTALAIDGSINPPVALDWDGVNFLNVPNIGLIDTCDNFIYTTGAFLNSQGLEFDGTHGTIAINNSILRGDGTSGDILKVRSTATVTRRFRVIYSSVIATGSTVGITVDPLATIPTEGFILKTVNFSGGGTYLGGLDATSNDSLFERCTGIENTSVNGQMYFQNNATATTISNTTDFFKVAGTTSASADNRKYTHTTGRLTNDAVIERTFLISVTGTFTSTVNNAIEFGIYDSTLGGIRTPSRVTVTALNGTRPDIFATNCVIKHNQGDYVEIHVRNQTAANNVTVDQLNVVVTEI